MKETPAAARRSERAAGKPAPKRKVRRKKRASGAGRKMAVQLPARRRRKRFGRRELLIIVLPAVAAVTAVIIVLGIMGGTSSYKLESDAYQYYGGSSAVVEKGSKLTRGDENTALLERSGGEKAETTLPIYLADSRKVVLPTDLLYYEPRSNKYSRLPYFSEIRCEENGAITVTRDGKTAQPTQGFLYDGEDFYLFLEPVTLSFNGYTMELPSLSYVEARYGGDIMVFNYDTKEFFIEASDGTGTAEAGEEDYEISLLGDSMTLLDGTKKLLGSRPELFDPLI